MKKLTIKGQARWPNLPCWEGNQPPAEDEAWELDASGMTWVEPSGMVALAAKAMRTGTRPCTMSVAPGDVTSYVQRMGLFRLLEQPEPYAIQSHPSGVRFTELSLLRPSMQSFEASTLCSRIAGVMAQGKPEVEDLFSYILGELTANVRQHAGSPGLVMAQAYPSEGTVEFAIADWGIGIAAGLAENPKFRDIEDREALDVAIRPNTSGKDWPGAPGYGERQNSGNGLFTLSFLAREAPGKFLLASGGWALYLNGRRTLSKALQCPFPGTLVSLRFAPGPMKLGILLGEAAKERGLASRQDDLIFE